MPPPSTTLCQQGLSCLSLAVGLTSTGPGRCSRVSPRSSRLEITAPSIIRVSNNGAPPRRLLSVSLRSVSAEFDVKRVAFLDTCRKNPRTMTKATSFAWREYDWDFPRGCLLHDNIARCGDGQSLPVNWATKCQLARRGLGTCRTARPSRPPYADFRRACRRRLSPCPARAGSTRSSRSARLRRTTGGRSVVSYLGDRNRDRRKKNLIRGRNDSNSAGPGQEMHTRQAVMASIASIARIANNML